MSEPSTDAQREALRSLVEFGPEFVGEKHPVFGALYRRGLVVYSAFDSGWHPTRAGKRWAKSNKPKRRL